MNPTQKPTHTPAALADLTPADILRCAARYLELRGWHKGTYYAPSTADNPFPPACTVGAIGLACFGETDPPMAYNRPEWPLYLRTQRYLVDYLDRADAVQTHDGDLIVTLLFDWNDEADRDEADVIANLRDTADDYDRRTHGGTR
ncbi:DUF6197 family protein [Micromonospora taraxaci]